MKATRKRTFGRMEVVFDLLYLLTVLVLGLLLLTSKENSLKQWYGVMALVLVAGDSFHLIPRIQTALLGENRRREQFLGRGKMLTSIGMTLFYLLLWQIGVTLLVPNGLPVWTAVACVLSLVRIVLCLLPQNRWGKLDAPEQWNWYRNIPFLLLGMMTAVLFWVYRNGHPAITWMWLAIFLSFAFYLPVVFGVRKNPKLGMLMLPKSGVYVWIIAMGFGL